MSWLKNITALDVAFFGAAAALITLSFGLLIAAALQK